MQYSCACRRGLTEEQSPVHERATMNKLIFSVLVQCLLGISAVALAQYAKEFQAVSERCASKSIECQCIKEDNVCTMKDWVVSEGVAVRGAFEECCTKYNGTITRDKCLHVDEKEWRRCIAVYGEEWKKTGGKTKQQVCGQQCVSWGGELSNKQKIGLWHEKSGEFDEYGKYLNVGSSAFKNGKWTVYDKYGAKYAEGVYKVFEKAWPPYQKTGKWTLFHDNGKVSEEQFYRFDETGNFTVSMPAGTWKSYDPSGNLAVETLYEGNNAKEIRYSQKGIRQKEINYVIRTVSKGDSSRDFIPAEIVRVRNGAYVEYDLQDRVLFSTSYDEGIRRGYTYIYNPDGSIAKASVDDKISCGSTAADRRVLFTTLDESCLAALGNKPLPAGNLCGSDDDCEKGSKCAGRCVPEGLADKPWCDKSKTQGVVVAELKKKSVSLEYCSNSRMPIQISKYVELADGKPVTIGCEIGSLDSRIFNADVSEASKMIEEGGSAAVRQTVWATQKVDQGLEKDCFTLVFPKTFPPKKGEENAIDSKETFVGRVKRAAPTRDGTMKQIEKKYSNLENCARDNKKDADRFVMHTIRWNVLPTGLVDSLQGRTDTKFNACVMREIASWKFDEFDDDSQCRVVLYLRSVPRTTPEDPLGRIPRKTLIDPFKDKNIEVFIK